MFDYRHRPFNARIQYLKFNTCIAGVEPLALAPEVWGNIKLDIHSSFNLLLTFYRSPPSGVMNSWGGQPKDWAIMGSKEKRLLI